MSKPNTDNQGRKRSVTVAFRVSPEEADLLDRLVDASGMSKQDYLTACIQNDALEIIPSTRTQRGMARQMDYAYRELRRMRSASEMTPELVTLLERLTRQFGALGATPDEMSEVEKESGAIEGLER